AWWIRRRFSKSHAIHLGIARHRRNGLAMPLAWTDASPARSRTGEIARPMLGGSCRLPRERTVRTRAALGTSQTWCSWIGRGRSLAGRVGFSPMRGSHQQQAGDQQHAVLGAVAAEPDDEP